jgi:hypothetical protein
MAYDGRIGPSGPLPQLRPTSGKGWGNGGYSQNEKANGKVPGLTCREGGPHRLGMRLDATDMACLVCGKARPADMTELRHPMAEPLSAAPGAGAYGAVDGQKRRAGDE